MIEVHDYRKVYGATVAVKGLTFTVNPGEILGLVGPNGAGKTTTLRAVAGIIPPTAGTIRIAGFDIRKAPVEAKRCMAYVPDDPKLFDALTIWEHLEFIASAYEVSDFVPKAERLLAEFDLAERRDTIAQELSRGMRQKTAVCCACLHDPAAMMFDEPIVGLDPRAIRTLKTSIRQRAQQGVAVVISSHMLPLVEDLCTHLAVLHRGEALFFGSVAEAHTAHSDPGANNSLEEVFFALTEGRELTDATDA